MIVCNSRKFIFVHLHKCAGTSVTASLDGQMKWNDIVLNSSIVNDEFANGYRSRFNLHKHSPANEIREVVGEDVWKSYFKFALVRHPIDRLISFYEFIRRVYTNSAPQVRFGSGFWRKTTGKQPPDMYPNHSPWNWPGMKAFLTTDTLGEFLRSEFFEQDQGNWSQSRSLTDNSGKLIVDFIGKVENIAADWASICKRLEIAAGLEFQNRSERQFSNHEQYLGPDDLALVKKIYAQDFESFGYSVG